MNPQFHLMRQLVQGGNLEEGANQESSNIQKREKI